MLFWTRLKRGCEGQNNIKSYLVGSNSCHFGELKCPNECVKLLSSESLSVHVINLCVNTVVILVNTILLPVLNVRITVPDFHCIVLT